GSNIIQIARACGAAQIIAVDVRADKLEAARKVGATHVIDASQEEVAPAAMEITGGRGVDVAFEALGRPQTILHAFGAVRDGGGGHGAASSGDRRGRTAIGTGAASGSGRAIAGMLASHGAAVGVCDLHEVGARTVAQEIEAAGGHAIPVRADVSRPDDVEAMVAATAREFGGLDILVNNAGLQFISPVHEFPVASGNRPG